MKIGRRVYYDKETGNAIVDTGERQGFVKETSIEKDIETHKALSERNRDTFDYIELEYSQYAQDFAESNGYRVNPETKELEFSYPDPDDDENEQEPVYRKPLSEEIEDLKKEKQLTQMALAETIEKQEADKTSNQVALAELLETLTTKGVL